jgi:zinc/manganese transport system substrate-binding protein
MLKPYALLAIAFLLLPISSQAKIDIFACEPEWRSLSEEIGGDMVSSFSATNAFQDPHYIRAKPSLIAKIKKADLLVCSGSDLEVGWLPILLSRAKHDIQAGQIGYLMASDFVPKIQKPEIIDRSMGDVHPQGNPHVHLNPYNILLVAKEIKLRLQKIDSINFQNYQKNYDDFANKWQKSIKKWENRAINLKGKKIITHHKSFSYLFDWLKLEEVANLEPNPGIAPTSKHLRNLLIVLKKEPVKFVIRTPYDSSKASKWIAKKTQIKELILPYTVGGNDKASSLFSLFDETVSLMLQY